MSGDSNIIAAVNNVYKDRMAAMTDEKNFRKELERMTKNGFTFNDSNHFRRNYKDYDRQYSSYFNWITGEPLQSKGYDAYRTGGKYASIANVDELFDKIMNQEEFTYDMSKDDLFQMYKNQYNQQGTRAMNNAMGVAAARSGGYNSSAAQTAAQTQYMGYMDALNNKAAETYQNALNMYNNKQEQAYNKYNAALQMNNAANDQFWAKTNTLQQQANNSLQAWMSDQQFEYNKYSDKLKYNQTGLNNARNTINWSRDYVLRAKPYMG